MHALKGTYTQKIYDSFNTMILKKDSSIVNWPKYSVISQKRTASKQMKR